jgi:cyclopropane-fatty-acyl-phospholipid synthase
MLLQAIVMPERRYEAYLNSVDFIRRYVFPGGSLPSIAAMLTAVGRTGGLRLVHLEDFAPHYGETLRRWRANFSRREAAIRALGYDDTLIRLWHYYLCYCEAAFEERAIGLVHLQFDNYACRRDPLRIGDRAAAAGAEPAFENQPGSAGRETACLA